MKIFTKLPLYLGLGVLVLAILISTRMVSEQRSLSNNPKASLTGAVLTMNQDGRGTVSVSLVSEKDVAGIDVVVKFDKTKIKILPSTLTSGSSFITSGGVVDDNADTFSFSALVKGDNVKSGIAGTFKVESIALNTESNLDFVTGEGKTAVIEKESGADILNNAVGTKLNLTAK